MKRGFLREHYWLSGVLQRIIDVAAILVGAQVAFLCAFYNDIPSEDVLPNYSLLTFSTVILTIVIFTRFDVYRGWRGMSKGDELRTLLSAWFAVFGVLACIGFATKTGDQYSRVWIGFWLFWGTVFLALFRVVQRYFVEYLRSIGFNQRHIVIVGDGKLGEDVYRRVSELNELGFQIHGYFNPGSCRNTAFEREGITTGSIKDFFVTIQKGDIDQVWIALPYNRMSQIRKVLTGLQYSTVDIRLVTDLFGFQLMSQSVTNIAGLPVVNLSVSPMNGMNRFLKAMEDKLFAVALLVMLSPLLLLISVAIKLTTKGPVFYRQERLSWNGKPFKMYKFRSMPVGVELQSGAVWAKSGENRATPIGSFLRKTSLDELPQLWNVLKGDMSIVGPRPERPVFVNKFKEEIPGYMHKHMVKAGITGWAQVNGWRGDTDLNKRIEYDLFYIKNWSLFLDLKIICLTIFKGLVHKNAY